MKGAKIIPSPEFRRLFPQRTHVTFGEVVGKARTADCLVVHWDGMETRETLHMSYIEFVKRMDDEPTTEAE